MAAKDSEKHGISIDCPMCDVEITITQDERPGDQIFCLYCSTPLKIRKKKETDEIYLEEDF